ncbi:hypothetical protein FB107DRAFT_213854 [Schizophyllum commune]
MAEPSLLDASSPALYREQQHIPICANCDHACHLDLNLPPLGPDNPVLRGGMQLSAQDDALIQESVVSTDAGLHHIRGIMNGHIKVLEHLWLIERRLKTQRDIYEAYYAPVRRLPAEIISLVFEFCCMGKGSVDLEKEQCEPLVLTSVCKFWRDIALSTPAIWATFNISEKDSTHTKAIAARLDMFLSRSGHLPLEHRVVFHAPWDRSDIEQRFYLLSQHSHRWTHLALKQSMNPYCSNFHRLKGLPLTSLTTLEGNALHLSDDSAKGVFDGLPNLRHVVLSMGSTQDDLVTIPHLPWAQLEGLVAMTPPAYALWLVRHCPRLAAWKYVNATVLLPEFSSVAISADPVTAFHLRKLHLTLSTTRDLSLIQLVSPIGLEHAHLAFDKEAKVMSASPFSLFALSSSTLRYLSLSNPPRSFLDPAFLASLRALITLEIQFHKDAPLTQDVVDVLTARNSIPELRNLELGGILDIEAKSLVEMVIIRHESDCPLQRLRLKGIFAPRLAKFGWSDEIETHLEGLVPDFRMMAWKQPMHLLRRHLEC